MITKTDVAIIGGGVIGSAIARELSRYDQCRSDSFNFINDTLRKDQAPAYGRPDLFIPRNEI